MRVVLTGAAGFIGSHVARMLTERGHEVVGVDSFEPQVHGGVSGADTIHILSAGALAHLASVDDFGPVPDVVVHLGARVGVAQSQYEIRSYVSGNVTETAALLEAYVAAKRCRRFVVASSMSVYGEGLYWVHNEHQTAVAAHGGLVREVERGWDAFRWRDGLPVDGRLTPSLTPESKPAEPASVYAMTKYDQERYTRLVGEAYGVETVALRFFNTYGPPQALGNPYTGCLAQLACRVLNGRPPIVFEDGGQMRDFVYVEDTAAAVVAAVEAEHLDGVYNVCTGHGTSVLDVAQQWCEIAAGHGFPSQRPDVTGEFRSGDIRHCVGDPAAYERATGWTARWAVADGLAKTADWIISNDLHHHIPPDRSADALGEARAHGLVRQLGKDTTP